MMVATSCDCESRSDLEEGGRSRRKEFKVLQASLRKR
jgi:hypothetical protein